MRINCHSHIFNFRSQNTARTRRTLVNRLTNDKWPAALVKVVSKLFQEIMKDDHLDEAGLLRKLLKELKASEKFKELLNSAVGGIPGNLSLLFHGNLDAMGVELMRRLIQQISENLSQGADIRTQNLEDVLGFLLIGMRPTIREVADWYFRQAPDNTAMVALMMDITEGGTADADKFEKQTVDTAKATLAYPGRILPFFAVNPLRTGHFKMLKKAVEERGFVGVKIYPSLGYAPDSAAMKKVYRYCVAHDLPVLMHCNQGGFFFRKEDIDYCNPQRWRNLLNQSEFADLKVCFAHFGGDAELARADGLANVGDWTGTILELMSEHSGVYADISYHTAPMNGGDDEARYFQNLHRMLQNSSFRDRVLFGSDFHLVRLRAREENYWAYFEQHLGTSKFDRIAAANANAYLGMPTDDGSGAKSNIVRYGKFLARFRDEVGQFPAPWVDRLLDVETRETEVFVPNPFGLEFTINVAAHYYTATYYATLFSDADRSRMDLSIGTIGNKQIRDVPGWPLETMGTASREQTFKAMAKSLSKFMLHRRGGRAKLKSGVSGTKAIKTLTDQFKRGSDKYFKFGEVVRSLYTFTGNSLEL